MEAPDERSFDAHMVVELDGAGDIPQTINYRMSLNFFLPQVAFIVSLLEPISNVFSTSWFPGVQLFAINHSAFGCKPALIASL